MTGHTGTVKALIKLNDGRLCSGSGDSTIKIWRLYERRLDVDLTSVHTNWVNALLQPKESDIIISGGTDNTIKIINLLNQNQIEYSFTVEKNVDCLVDLDNEEFASNSGDEIIIFNWKTKEKVYQFEGSFSTVVSMAYIDGNLIAGAVNGNIKIYDMSNKQKKSNIKDTGNLSDVKVIGKNILAVAIGNGIKLWNMNEKTEIRTLVGHAGDVKAIAKIEGSLIVSGGSDKMIKIWE